MGRWNSVRLRRLGVPFVDGDGQVDQIVSAVVFSWRRSGAAPLIVDRGSDGVPCSSVDAVDQRRRD